MPDEKILYLYFNAITALQDKWDKEQKKELVVLTKRLAKQVEMSELKQALRSFADEGISHLGKIDQRCMLLFQRVINQG